MPLDTEGFVVITKETRTHARVFRCLHHGGCTFLEVADSVQALTHLLAKALDAETCGTQEKLLRAAFDEYRRSHRLNSVTLSADSAGLQLTHGGVVHAADTVYFETVPLTTSLFDLAARLYSSLEVDPVGRASLLAWRTIEGSRYRAWAPELAARPSNESARSAPARTRSR